jgi:putative FmdB family regulatory protein
MPTYEFRCPLGHEFEKFYRSIGVAQSEATCPECGKVAERMMSAGAGLVFKGSGFYLTDYGKNAHQKRGDAKADGAKSEGGSSDGAKSEGAKSEGSGGESSASAKTDAKGETKSQSKPAESKPAAPSKPSAGE